MKASPAHDMRKGPRRAAGVVADSAMRKLKKAASVIAGARAIAPASAWA
jgi:hypothetical protein